jgi:hypothetical protein
MLVSYHFFVAKKAQKSVPWQVQNQTLALVL